MGAFNTSRAAAQTFQTNQMAAQRRADALAAAQNYVRPPPVQPAPAMQPGSAGPAIAGAPLPSVNSMGAGMPMPAAAPAAPANAMRDITPLLQFAGDNGPIDALIAENVRGRAAAAADVDNRRQQSAADIQRGQYTQGLLQQGALSLLDDQSDETILRVSAQIAAMPGVDVPTVNANRDALLAMPPEQRRITVRRTVEIDAGASRAANFNKSDIRYVNRGSSLDPVEFNANAPGYTTPVPLSATLSPAAQAADTRADEENTREDARDLRRRWDAYDDAVATHDRWVASAEGPAQQAQRAQAPRPRPPAEPRPGSTAPAPAPAAPAAPGAAPPTRRRWVPGVGLQ
jgi:hypothetical protein